MTDSRSETKDSSPKMIACIGYSAGELVALTKVIRHRGSKFDGSVLMVRNLLGETDEIHPNLLATLVIPKLLDQAVPGESFRFLVPSCATGQEALAIKKNTASTRGNKARSSRMNCRPIDDGRNYH